VRRNAQNRNDTFEAEYAGADLEGLKTMPPCLVERATSLSPRAITHTSRLDYSNYSADHHHILPARD
jgi:hypothetical protein